MTNQFTRCLPIELGYEGGWVNDPQDSGGETNLGVTKRNWEAWVGHSVTSADMKALTGNVVAPFYKTKYWDVICGDHLPIGLDLIIFDSAINQGPGRAAKFLQSAIGATPDGVIGPVTLATLASCDVAATIHEVRALREAQYRSLPTFDHFGAGWINRLNGIENTAASWIVP